MLKFKKLIAIVLSLIGLGIFLFFNSYQQQSAHDQHMATQTAVSFMRDLSKGDSNSAFQYVWSGEQLHIRSNETVQSFKDAAILEILQVNKSSAKNRPAYYQQFQKINSVMLKIKIVHEDKAGHPPGDYILFITVVQKTPQSNWMITELGSGA